MILMNHSIHHLDEFAQFQISNLFKVQIVFLFCILFCTIQALKVRRGFMTIHQFSLHYLNAKRHTSQNRSTVISYRYIIVLSSLSTPEKIVKDPPPLISNHESKARPVIGNSGLRGNCLIPSHITGNNLQNTKIKYKIIGMDTR